MVRQGVRPSSRCLQSQVFRVPQTKSDVPKPKGADMKADKTAQGTDPSSIPGEFRENYRFLTELIDCEEKNNSASKTLEDLVKRRLNSLAGKLNRRQIKILNDFLKTLQDRELEPIGPPVPSELEASIRVKKRSTWLPWEAEAIRKIERWRGDLAFITENWTSTSPLAASSSSKTKTVRMAKKS